MNRRSKNYQVLKPFSFYDDLSVFARFICLFTLKGAQSAQEKRYPLRNWGTEYPELVNTALLN